MIAIQRNIMDWEKFPGYDLIWTDPPWGESLVKMFNTIVFKQTGVRPETTFEEIMIHFSRLAHPGKPIVMEFGRAFSNTAPEIMAAGGHRLLSKHPAVQSNGRPFDLYLFNREMNIVTEGVKGFEIITASLRASSMAGKVVFDPFAGMGRTARAVRLAGCDYIGSEISPVSFQKLCKEVGECQREE